MEGVTRYHELFRNMKRQHKRIVNAVGQEEFNTILQRFPVVLDDGAVMQVAESLGWNSDWLRSATSRVAKPRPKPLQHQVRTWLSCWLVLVLCQGQWLLFPGCLLLSVLLEVGRSVLDCLLRRQQLLLGVPLI